MLATPEGYEAVVFAREDEIGLNKTVEVEFVEDGTIILIGACPEGLGSAKFESWLKSANSAHEMVERIGREFELGGHKAAAIGLVLERASIDFVSEMDDDFVRSIFLNPQPSAQVAFSKALERYGENATVIAMPFGGATLPMPPAI